MAKAELCRRSFFYFVTAFWPVIIPEPMVANWHINYLCQELEAVAHQVVKRQPKEADVIINIPPGTTKSTITTIMLPPWIWILDPTIRVISNSYSADLAKEHAVKSRDIILSDQYKRMFPEIKIRRDKSAKMSYENTKTGARYVTSTGGTITGKHAHLIINDDPLNPQQASSDADRFLANEHTKTLSSRKVDKENTPTITIMQRVHEMDVTGYLMGKKGDKIKHYCLPAESTGNVKPPELRERYIDGLLDPIRLNRKILQEAMTDLGSRMYSCQYDQSPVAKGGNIIKRDWFKYITPDDFNTMRVKTPVVFFIDTAFTDKTENDPSGIIATQKFRENIYITAAAKFYLEFPDLIKRIQAWVKSNGYKEESSIRIEPKANGLSVIQQLKETTPLNIVKGPAPTDSKETRLRAKSAKIEAGRVILVAGPWNDEFVEEITGFPAKPHDEFVDLIGYAIDYHLSEENESQDLDGVFF